MSSSHKRTRAELRAMAQMKKLINEGVEFPDAHTRAVIDNHLTEAQAEHLAELYTESEGTA